MSTWFTQWKDGAEAALQADVSLDVPWALVERFSKLVRESGTEQEVVAARAITDQLRAFGVPHTHHEPEVLISLPRGATLELTAPQAKTLRAKTPAMSASTGGKPIDGDLVYLSTGQAGSIISIFEKVDAVTADVAGKVVLTEGYPSPGKVKSLQDAGAAGAVFISPGERIHEGICTTIWGSPDLDSLPRKPRIPVVAISKPDGAWLRDLAQTGPVRIRYSTNLEERWRKIPVLEAVIRGTEEPEKFVLMHGHLDSWHEGIGDNATGDATLLECARVLWKHRDKLRRSVRIAWWSGHSHGRYAGSVWYADAHAIDIDENCVAHINCDSPGCRDASAFDDVFWMAEAESLAKALIKDVTGQDAEGGRPLRAGDKSFSNIGVPTFFMLSSNIPKPEIRARGLYAVGGCGMNIEWHTEADTIEIADRGNLLRDIKLYAVAAFRTANAPLYALDLARTAADIGATLEKYQQAAGGQFDLSGARAEARGLEDDLRRFYQAAKSLDGKTVGDPAVARFNEVQRAVSRLLVGVNYARMGRFWHDPAVDVPPLPDLEPCLKLGTLPADSDAARVTRTHLVRGRNRLTAALREARRAVAREART